MEWLTNVPRDFMVMSEGERELYRKHSCGDPKATSTYSVQRLKEMGYIGLYRSIPKERVLERYPKASAVHNNILWYILDLSKMGGKPNAELGTGTTEPLAWESAYKRMKEK